MLKGFSLTILLCLMGFPQAYAAVSLSVNPVDGTSILHFERVPVAGPENYKEIRVRTNSSNGNRYQVFLRVLEPVMDEKGDMLNLQAVKMQTLMNSNSYGTLYMQNSGFLSMDDQLLYTSGQNGQSDMFTVGYSLNQNLVNAAGSFRGRLVFTVRGMGNASSDQQMIDIVLETSSSFHVSVRGLRNHHWLHIRDTDTTYRAADAVKVSFSGNLGQEVKIYQVVDTMPQNETEQELGEDIIQMDVQGNSEGLRLSGLSSLTNNRTLLYSSNNNEDSFVIYFLVDSSKVQKQDAGIYRGKLKYEVETEHGQKEFPINLQFDVGPVFSINVSAPAGGVSFAHVLPNSPPQEQEVTVKVFSNLHKPYQVIQDLKTNMTNPEGKEFNSSYFNIQVEIPSGQRGQTNLTEFSPVQTGEYPIFTSDARGSGATFTVVYRLQGYAHMSAGNFSAPVMLSLNQK